MATLPPSIAATPSRLKSQNTAAVSIIPSQKSQDGLLKYFKDTTQFLNNNFNIRAQLLDRDRAYYREKDFANAANLRAKTENRVGNPKPIQNVTIPVVMPQVETAVSYLSDIFLTGYPIFPISTGGQNNPDDADGANDDPALQMETLVGEHSVKFAWAAELLMNLRDGLKYNLMAAEVEWKEQRVWSIGTDTASTVAASKTVETYFQGNKIKRLNPYNLILDTRVENPSMMHIEGEFAGYTELISRIQLKQLIADLGDTNTMNARAAFESGTGTFTTDSSNAGFYLPQINPTALNQQNQNIGMTTTNWGAWAGLDKPDGIKYSNMYEKSVLYCRIIPSDFDLSTAAKNTIQIWKLIVINRQVLILAQRQTNAHNYLPIIVGQPTEDGLGWQTKSFAENVAPMQDAATALYTSGIESQRRKVYDRLLYDPSRIDKSAINNVDAVARIPVKQVAYGTQLQEAVHIFPYVDNGVSNILEMSAQIAGFADKLNGQNPAQQGQFQKGNRSRAEFQSIMGSANGRLQIMAILLEYKFFQPIKEIIKLNILQFQPPATLFNRNTKSNVQIDPVAIRNAALEFKLSDGLLPVAKMQNLDILQTILQMSATNPQIGAEYDIVGMIMHAIQEQGGAWVNDFKRTAQQQQQVLQNQQATSGTTDANGNPIQPTAVASAQSNPGTNPGAALARNASSQPAPGSTI